MHTAEYVSVQPLDNFLEHAAKVHNQVSTTRERKSPDRKKESEKKKSLCCVSKSEQVWIISISAMMTTMMMMRPSLKNVLDLIHAGDVTSCAVKSTRWHEDTQRALRVVRSRRGEGHAVSHSQLLCFFYRQ